MSTFHSAAKTQELYEATVPDTLDLAERARLAVNALTGSADRERGCEPYTCANFNVHPAYMNHVAGGPCTPKVIEALPMMRIASGSNQDLDVDREMLEAVMSNVGEDGLWWIPGMPWYEESYRQDSVWIGPQSRLVMALMDRHKLDGDPRWLEAIQRMVAGLASKVIHKGEHAYYPGDLCPWPDWKLDADGFSTSAFSRQRYMAQGTAVRALSRWYASSGDEKALALAKKLLKSLLEPERWMPSAEPKMVVSAEHAHWSGHFHTYTATLWGVLEYATVSNDAQLKQFMREFYEYARNFGIPRFGFFPAVIGDHGSYVVTDTQAYGVQPCEGCGIADMICLAIGLCDAGVGDYWEDVDQYVRNQLVEHQILDGDLLEDISRSGPEFHIQPEMMTAHDVIQRNIGTFSSGTVPTLLYPLWTICCVGNCSVALYKAWESIVRYADGVAQVNLLLNRASPWLDIDSYLPYEGKVVIRNKTAQRVYVRIPLWVEKSGVRCSGQAVSTPLVWLNNYLIIDGLAGSEVITIEFPMVETVERYTEPTYETQYTCHFKGNTLVDISPRAKITGIHEDVPQDDGLRTQIRRAYPIYQRDHYKGDTAPTVKRVRYVSPVVI